MPDNYDAWRIVKHSPENFLSLTLAEQLLYLCKLAHLAPSSHNSQPWRFLIGEINRSISVYLDRAFVLPASDPTGRQALISIGCAIENILIAAEYYGLVYSLKILKINKKRVVPGKDLCLLAEIKFDAPNKIAEPSSKLEGSYNAIFKRKVIRAEYDPEKVIPEKIILKIQNIAEKDSTIRFHHITNRLLRLSIAEFQGQADSSVMNSRSFSRELGDWLLPNDTDSGLGMPGAGFGLQDEQAQRINLALSGKQRLEPEDSLRFSLAGKMGIEKSPLIGFLSAKNDSPTGWLEAGRAFERVFLALNEAEISVAIHAGIVEVSLVNKMFSAMIGTTRRTLVVFRAGWPKNENDTNRPHSPRLPIEKVIITSNSGK